MDEIFVLDHFLHVIRNIGTEVIATIGQFTHRQLFLADIEKDQRLNVVDVFHAETVKLGLDHF